MTTQEIRNLVITSIFEAEGKDSGAKMAMAYEKISWEILRKIISEYSINVQLDRMERYNKARAFLCYFGEFIMNSSDPPRDLEFKDDLAVKFIFIATMLFDAFGYVRQNYQHLVSQEFRNEISEESLAKFHKASERGVHKLAGEYQLNNTISFNSVTIQFVNAFHQKILWGIIGDEAYKKYQDQFNSAVQLLRAYYNSNPDSNKSDSKPN